MRWFVSLFTVLLALTAEIPAATTQKATTEASAVVSDLTSNDVRYIVPFTPDGLNSELSVQATEQGISVD